MYTKEELKELDIIPKLNNISLKIIQEFFCENLINKSFKYKIKLLETKEEHELDIRFFTENLPHLLGIQKLANYNQKYRYTGKRGYLGIQEEAITIKSLKDLDKGLRTKGKSQRVFPQIESRITHFHLIHKLMNECEMVRFDNKKVEDKCVIKSDFILYHEDLGVKLHLGVIKEQHDKTYYVPVTFIVKSLKDRHKDRLTIGQEYATIVERSIEVLNKKDNSYIFT